LDSAWLAIEYLESSKLPDGRLARFYELATNRPLYFTKDYRLTYQADDLPTHYAWVVECRVDSLRERWHQVARQTEAEREVELDMIRGLKSRRLEPTAGLSTRVMAILEAQDERGAWVKDGRMRTFGPGDTTHRVIESETMIRNVEWLSEYLAEVGQGRGR
jgi:hypothetical protein